MLLNLWVRDKTNGIVHQVGTDVHDSVEFLDGQVVFVNMQSTASTFDDYEWADPPELDGYVSVTPDQLWLNHRLLRRELMSMLSKGWISVEDRLPDRSGTYLVIGKNGTPHTAHFYAEAPKFSNRYVKFWMPLPTAPIE